MSATVLYELFDKGRKGEAIKKTEQEARLFLENAFVRHRAKGRSVRVESNEYEASLYLIKNTDDQVVAKYKLVTDPLSGNALAAISPAGPKENGDPQTEGRR